jgi:hypothetical protein
MANKALTLTIVFILLGLCFSYLIAGTEGWWGEYYYLWDKGKDFLLILSLVLFSLTREKIHPDSATACKGLLVFFLIRIAWESLAIPDYELAAGVEIIDALFTINLTIMIVVYLKASGWNLK